MKHIFTNKLATHNLDDEGWDYLEDVYSGPDFILDWPVVDCRMMEDGPGNPLAIYQYKIDEAIRKLDKYGKVLIGCHAGISRSNAIAAGVLMKKYKYEYQDALDLVHEKVKIDLIEPAHLSNLRKLQGWLSGDVDCRQSVNP